MLDATALSRIIDYCKASSNEVGGYIDRDNRFIPMVNTAADPSELFVFNNVPDDAKMIIHSHPGGPFAPSIADQRAQLSSDIPWGIVAFDNLRTEFFTFGDNAPIPPLVGRGFRHYVTDCYAACRDLYRVHCEVTLPHYPREWEWWLTDARMLEHGYHGAGFSEVPQNAIQAGDAVLMSIRSTTPNHSAVWLGEGLIYHHLSGKTESDPMRLAIVENVGRWVPYITTVLRNADDRITRASWPHIRKILQTRG